MVTYAVILGPDIPVLPDDTEEALVGSSIHQDVIMTSVSSLRRRAKQERLPWFVGNQLKMLIPRHDGGVYQPSPDILIHPTLGPAPRTSLNVVLTGPPFLVMEVASPATAEAHDLNTILPTAKPQIYAACGIPEYLVFDPLGDFVPDQVRAWRLGPAGVYIPWEAGSDGRWHSALGVAFAPQGVLLRVYGPDGQSIPSGDDLDDLLAEKDARIAALEAELRRLRGE